MVGEKRAVGNDGRYTSQSNEDAIIADIFSKIGMGKKRFLEFGCGDGRQNNTIALVHQGWSGKWLDGHRRRILSAKERFAEYPNLKIFRRKINPRNVNKWVTGKLEFLSIDVDGADYDIWYALSARPHVVCIEYDAGLPTRKKGQGGTPLEIIKELGEAKGYLFYGVSASNVNAFFVAKEKMMSTIEEDGE